MKVTLIGAGSVLFTRAILADLFSFNELGEFTIALHDIDSDRLAVAEAVARSMNESTHGSVSIETHSDRRQALEGADYAVNAIAVGGYAAIRRDLDIPKSYGLRQTIADTIGVGGIFRGLRTIPAMLAIGNDMAEVCPDAWLLSYTNPMAMLPWAVYEGTPFKRVVGLCHSIRDTEAMLAALVGVPQEEIAFTTAGFNHQAFVLRFERGHQDLYPLLNEIIDRDPEGLGRRVRVELFRRFGCFPTESSEHSVEYVPWFIRDPAAVERYRVQIELRTERSERLLREYEDMKEAARSGAPFDTTPTGELAPLVIHSIETGTRRMIHGNVKNDGLIPDLPDACCVEVPCVVDRSGVRPIAVGHLPPQIAGLNRTFLNVVELTVRAALDGDRDHVYHAAMLDPNTAATLSLDEIKEMCDALIAAHGELIPASIRT